MTRRFRLGGSALLLLATTAFAADPAVPSVTVEGTAEIRRAPETLRVQFEALSQGATLKDALANLKSRRDDVRAGLEKLGVSKDAIQFQAAVLVPDISEQQGRIDRFMSERNRVLNKPKPGSTAPVVVSTTVQANFTLTATTSHEDLLIAAREIEGKVKAADLGGLKQTGKPTPQEEEAAEESSGSPNRGESRGEPVFLYVCKISDAERSKALAEAFAKAKKDAQRLAKAAGGDVAEVRQLSSQLSRGDMDDFERYSRREFMQNYYRLNPNEAPNDSEAFGMQPGKVSVRIGLTVQFALKMPAK